MTILKSLSSLIQSAIDVSSATATMIRASAKLISDAPDAVIACVEMAREAEANRASIRASEAFESVCPGGPALYHANSQI
jgi:hypothetical protein